MALAPPAAVALLPAVALIRFPSLPSLSTAELYGNTRLLIKLFLLDAPCDPTIIGPALVLFSFEDFLAMPFLIFSS